MAPPLPPARDPPAPPSRPVGHLLLLEGASGAGKSTFIRHLQAGLLPGPIEARLPDGARAWPVVEVDRLDDWLLAQGPEFGSSAALEGLVAHLDLVDVKRNGSRGYDDDPTSRVIELGERITIVRLRPPVQVLRQNLAGRLSGGSRLRSLPLIVWRERVGSLWWRGLKRMAMLAARLVPRTLKRGPRVGRLRRRIHEGHRPIPEFGTAAAAFDIYRRPEELDRLYRDWGDHLARSRGDAVEIIAVTPTAAPVSWRLAEE